MVILADVGVYTQAKLRMVQGLMNWETSNIRALLVDNAYVYNFAHQRVSDIVAHEVSGGTYARVDVPLREFRPDASGNRILLWATHLVFPGLTGVSPRGLVLYEENGPDESTPHDDWLIAHIDFGAPEATTGYNFLVEFNAEGVIAFQDC